MSSKDQAALFSNGAFIWLGNERLQLVMDEDQSFSFPKGTGSYVLEVDLQTNRGSAQYVGNIVIQ
ncbi:hypothetical protein [Rossellomorea sp. NPDC077527]|uniref:hypothetical protein n=1 Tax=Rossellomorea sp. NPDC077527 TaxID=3364510 RepID=UPI0037C5D857